jgi:regulator of protease activity HflC (stomatin/prohibitin superfamily)
MFGIGYFKAQPAEYIIKYSSGKIVKQGKGLTFFYLKYNTQIVAIPTTSIDANFVFNEITNNFQSATLQGQFTYHIENPVQAGSLLNFTINPVTRLYLSQDPTKLQQRIANVIQMETRVEIQKRTLEETLSQYQEIAVSVLARIRESKLLESLGVELLNIYFLSAKPTPEVGKALEAEYRETLLRKADEAIYRRRAAAVEEERKIKENELNTQITLEQQKEHLIRLEGINAEQKARYEGKALELEAEYRSKAIEMELAPYKALDHRTILSLAMKELGENAGKIGNLTITSEILAALLDTKK